MGQGVLMKFDTAAISQQLGVTKTPLLPPVTTWNPELSGDIDLFINRQGVWFHEGTRFERHSLAKMFSSILRKDGDAYFVLTPVEKWRIKVEDVPFVINHLMLINPGPDQILELQTSLGDRVCVDAEHPLWLKTDAATGEPSPYVRVRDRLDALLTRSVFYELINLATERNIAGKIQLGIYSSAQFFTLLDDVDASEV